MSYVMVAVAHGPTIETKPGGDQEHRRRPGAVLALHASRIRDEAVEIFAKMVPGTDVAIGKQAIQHISFDPRMSPAVLRAFENAEDEVLMNTLKGAPRLDVPSLFRPGFMARGREGAPGVFRGSAEVEGVGRAPNSCCHAPRKRASGTCRRIDCAEMIAFTGSPAFAGDDANACGSARSSVQHQRRACGDALIVFDPVFNGRPRMLSPLFVGGPCVLAQSPTDRLEICLGPVD